MKTIAILAMLTLVVSSCAAQSAINPGKEDEKFIVAMEKNLKMLDTASSGPDLTMLANNFERIGNAENKYWQPWYYAALCYGFMAVNVTDKKMIDPLAEQALKYLDKASAISPRNSEISALWGMLINTRILVDPIARWQAFSAEATAFLKESKDLDPSNPRPYLIEARTKLFTPAAMGGGPEAAKPIIEKALNNFAIFTTESRIAPNWGLSQAQKLLAKITAGK